jgi:UDP-N-acetylmuramyl pentapeptide synthase
MGEVGDQGDQFHTEIGAYAQSKGIDYLYATGKLSIHAIEAFNKKLGNARGVHFAEQTNLLEQIKASLYQHEKNMNEHVAVLVKVLVSPKWKESLMLY